MSQDVANTDTSLPECPNYVAHPQAVWFNEHWRPIFEARDEEIKALNQCQEHNRKAWKENKRLREELEDARDALVNAYDDIAHCNTVGCVPIVDEVNSAGNAAKQATRALALKDVPRG